MNGSSPWSPSPRARCCSPLPWIALGPWWAGRAHASATDRLDGAGKNDDDTGLVVTADTIVLALQNIPIAPLRRAFKESWMPAFHTLPVRDGQGYFAVFSPRWA